MHLLQDWLDVVLDDGDDSITQSASRWVNLDAFQDITFWLEVKSLQSGPYPLSMNYETAPVKDPTLFVPMATVTFDAPIITPAVTPVLATWADTTVPLAGWVRWRLSKSGHSGSRWGACFRILCSPKRSGFTPTRPAVR